MWIVQESIRGVWVDVAEFDEETDADLVAGHIHGKARVIWSDVGTQLDLEDAIDSR